MAALRAKISFTSGRDLRDGEDETKRYSDLECALDDCLIKSSQNKVIVSKHWNKSADDPIDYDIVIVDDNPISEEELNAMMESDAQAMDDMYKEGKELGIYDDRDPKVIEEELKQQGFKPLDDEKEDKQPVKKRGIFKKRN